MIFQTISYSLLMPLNCVVVDIHNTLQTLECNEADIVFFVHQEAAQDVYAQNTKP